MKFFSAASVSPHFSGEVSLDFECLSHKNTLRNLVSCDVFNQPLNEIKKGRRRERLLVSIKFYQGEWGGCPQRMGLDRKSCCCLSARNMIKL